MKLNDVTAKVVIYEAFVEGKLEAPKYLARTVHDLYFKSKFEEYKARTVWSLSNAFTSAFKELDPIPQFKATAKLGEFLERNSTGRSNGGRPRSGRPPGEVAALVSPSVPVRKIGLELAQAEGDQLFRMPRWRNSRLARAVISLCIRGSRRWSQT